MEADYAVIGGGVVGLSVAWGLLRRGRTVIVIDGDDGSFRASRGNFGLVWVQGKGANNPAYARWTRRSAAAWKQFSSELEAASGTSLCLQQDGGYDFFFDDEELQQTVAKYERLKAALGGDYPFEVLGHNALKKEEPGIGQDVIGAVLHHEDGHVNPLRLLRTLAVEVRRLGGTVRTGCEVTGVTRPDSFRLTCADGAVVEVGKVVLAAGLGAATLGSQLGFKAQVRPQRGQVLITEKLPGLMKRPSAIIRQVDEGGVQIGDSNEEVGFNDTTTLEVTARIAARAARVYPALARAKLVRSWAALRVMSPDGLPVYQQSTAMPGAYLVTCHSGITLAAAHALYLPEWLEGSEDAPDLAAFSEERFDVQAG